MRSLIAFWRNYCKVKLVILLLIQLISISFLANADTFKDISIAVWSDTLTEKINLILHKEKLSGNIEIAADDEVLSFLKENVEKIEEYKQNLEDAEKENKSQEEIDSLKKRIEEAEEEFTNSLETIKIVLKAEYPGPICLPEEGFPLFYFEAEGGVDEKIKISEFYLMEEDIEAELIVKDTLIEVTQKDDGYELVFDKAKDITIKFQGQLRGKAELKYGVKPQINNPITFEEKRSLPGHSFKIKIPVGKIKENENLHVYFMSKDLEPTFVPFIPVGEEKIEEQGRFYIFKPLVPGGLQGDVNVTALIVDDKGEVKAYNSSKFHVKNQLFGVGIGALVTILVVYSITLLIKGKRKSWLWAPLDFTKTPIHRYSISLLQILIWTAITIFSYIYVLLIKGECIHLTSQILILLGISGGTSLAAKGIALGKLKDIPDKYFIEHGVDLRKKRTPKFRDYVSIGGIPNLFKFQILGFTVITGIFVVWELIKTANFPEIPNELMTLMGISGGVYVVNEIATKNDWEKIEKKLKNSEEKYKKWQEIKPQIEEIEKSVKEKEEKLKKIKPNIEEIEKSIKKKEEKLKVEKLETEQTKLKEDIREEKEELEKLETELTELKEDIRKEKEGLESLEAPKREYESLEDEIRTDVKEILDVK